MPLVYLPQLRLNAELEGPTEAPVLVLSHALGTSLDLWKEIKGLFTPYYRVLAYDHRGHGKSDVPPPPYGMGALVRDLECLMNHFHLRDAVVVGCSLGGLVAQGLAIKRLDLVRGMVLANTAARIGSPRLWHQRIAEVRDSGLGAYAVSGALQRMLGPKWPEHPQRAVVEAMLTATAVDGWAGCAAAIAGTDFYTPTAALRLPTLAIAGSNDGTTPPDLVRETAELIPGHRFALIRGAGHLPMLEKPAEFAALLQGFLTEIGHV